MGMELRMACRYFSCSRLLEVSEEVGAGNGEIASLDVVFSLTTSY